MFLSINIKLLNKKQIKIYIYLDFYFNITKTINFFIYNFI